MIIFEHFSISFLKKKHPQFRSVVPGEDRPVVMKREVVIQNDASPQTVNEEPDTVVVVGTFLGGLE